jgi:hypothetical protein
MTRSPLIAPNALKVAPRLCLVGVGFRKAQHRVNAVYFVAIGRIDRVGPLASITSTFGNESVNSGALASYDWDIG